MGGVATRADELTTRSEALKNVLEDRGYAVAALDSCEAALEYLHNAPRPELIMLDLMMSGGMEGWDVRHKQKQDPELSGIPVISVSAVGKLVDVDVVLRKPLDYDEVLEAVERYVPKDRRGRCPSQAKPSQANDPLSASTKMNKPM